MSSRPVTSRRDLLTLGRRSSAPPAATAAAAADNVHIASLLVQALPQRVAEARAALATLPGAELQDTPHPGKFIVLLECSDEQAIAQCVNQLHAAPGVLTVSIVAHLVEDADTLDEEMNDGNSAAVSQG